MSIDNRAEGFIREYIKTFDELASKVKPNDKQLLFPIHLALPHKIKCIISSVHGVAFEWSNQSDNWGFEVIHTDQIAENFVLPTLKGKIPFFKFVGGNNNIVSSLNLITKEYYDRHKQSIEVLSRAANLILENAGSFVNIQKGDVRLIDIGLAWSIDGDDYVRKVRCIWLFGDHEDINVQAAVSLANQDYSAIVSRALGGIPLTMLVATLAEYRKLLQKENLMEDEMQRFLQHNFVILEHSYKRIFTKDELRKFKMPEADFLIETYDGKYVIIELESPQDKLFTDEKPPNPSKELRNAQSQIQQYFSFFRNNILYCRNIFPEISVENISGLIIIGRSNKLNDKQKQSLSNLVGVMHGCGITTYDELFKRTNSLLENISIRYGMSLH